MRGYLVIALAVLAVLLPADAAAATVKPNGTYTGQFGGGVGSVTLTFAKGQLKGFVATHVKLTNSTCDGHNANKFTAAGTLSGGPGKPKFQTTQNPYLTKDWGATASWNHTNQVQDAGATLGWTLPKTVDSLKINLFIQWNYNAPNGYTGICQSKQLVDTVKLKGA